MLKHTRRRALGLFLAAGIGLRLVTVGRALAQDEAEDAEESETEEVECYDSKSFDGWNAQASDKSAGAIMKEVPVINPESCDVLMELQVNSEYDAKVFVSGDPETTPLPEEFLIKPENRLIAKTVDGTVVVDEKLCGNCTDIYDDNVGIVLPLATAPLFREQDTFELAVRLDGKEKDCRFTVDAATLRKALDWATARRDELAERRDNDECTSPEGCFIITACAEVLGLGDDCFELRTLRCYRDEVLARQPGGRAAIMHYYALAPRILARMPAKLRKSRLLPVYARYVLPAAVAAHFGLNALTYRLYVQMMDDLARDVTMGPGKVPRPLH
jgi:hypothetical protein